MLNNFYTFMTYAMHEKGKRILSNDEMKAIGEIEPWINHSNFQESITKIARIIGVTPDLDHIIFSNRKALNSYPLNDYYLNERGLHPFRVIFSRLAHEIRQNRYASSAGFRFYDRIIRQDFNKVGIVEVGEFLEDPKEVEFVAAACKTMKISSNKQDHNIISMMSGELSSHLERVKSKIFTFLNCVAPPTPQSKYEYRSKFDNNTFLQHIVNSPNDNDEQKDFHSDIFFPAIKFWYFPEDVTIFNGPLVYSKGSVDDCYLLDYYYDKACEIASGKNPLTVLERSLKSHKEGSFRSVDVKRIDYMTVPANTLIIANVYGLHARANTKNESHRYAIHGSIRLDNPFEV